MHRIDTHQHLIPPGYRKALRRAGIDGNRLSAAGLETYPGLEAAGCRAIDRTNALALFPRVGIPPRPAVRPPLQQLRHTIAKGVMRAVMKLMEART